MGNFSFLMMDTSSFALFPLVFLGLLAFYVAANLGANDVANSMGTSVGSKALTLRQAIIIAGILEFTGAVLFGQGVSETLATGVVNPDSLGTNPSVFVVGMVSVLISAGVWLQFATSRGLPVSSSHAVVGAIAGFSIVAGGLGAVKWPTIGVITLSWLATPLISGAIAAVFFSVVQFGILESVDPVKRLRLSVPVLSFLVIGVFGVIVFPALKKPISVVFLGLGWDIPPLYGVLAIALLGVLSLIIMSWRVLAIPQASENDPPQPPEVRGETVTDESLTTSSLSSPSSLSPPSSPSSFFPLPSSFSSPSSFFPLPSSFSSDLVEKLLGRFQVLSACFVAFAHGSNDVGNAIAPLAAISYVRRTGVIPLDRFDIPLWIFLLGGAGIVTGLAIWGKNVISTVGENIIELKPSRGFCAELATATTVLVASRLGLPVSTSHALVGAVVGVGFVQGVKDVKFDTVKSIILAWVVTIPLATLISAGIFSVLRLL
jgi:PiT family inorganic phosphate transporter